MTAIGIQLGWLAVRFTVVALVAAVFVWWSARRSARSAVVVLSGVMAISLALSVTAFCPVPESCRWSPANPETMPEAVARADGAVPMELEHGAPPEGFELAKAWRLLQRLSDQTPQSSVGQHSSAIMFALYGLGATIAFMRLLVGWSAVRALRRRSRLITDVSLCELADSLRGILGCSRRVELRECSEPGLAATVGWWRPVIFLPPEWPDWTPAELRAVIAHELSHIQNGDYLISLVTRLCQAVHFYHPLMHWLSAQMRWQQELAADALAVSVLVDRNQYLKALASLALRSPARMSAGAMPWSAMTGGELLRRIHMLRGTQNGRPLGWTMRGLLVAFLAGIGMLLTTLGSPALPPDQPAEKAEPFEIGYLHPDAKGFVAIRPAFLLRQPAMEKAIRLYADELLELKKTGITVPDALKPENIEEIVTDVHISSEGTGKPRSRAMFMGSHSLYLRLNQEFDWPAFFKNLSKEVSTLTKMEGFEVKEIRDDGVIVYRLSVLPLFGPAPVFFHMPDRRTVVFSGILRKSSDEKNDVKAFRQLVQNVAQARQRDWGGYSKVARVPIAAVLDNHDQYYAKIFAKDLQPDELKILEDIRFAAVGIEIGEGRPVRLILDAKSAAAAPALEKAIGVVSRSMPEKIKQAKPDDEHDKVLLKLATELLQSQKAHREGARIELVGFSSVRLHDLFDFRDQKSSGDKPD